MTKREVITARRDAIKAKPGLGQTYRLGVFVLGLICIGIGLGLAVLPGPLTIPPVLLGLWIWSTEFGWAERLFDSWQAKGRQAWQKAKQHPKQAAAVTIGGLAVGGITIYLVTTYKLVDRLYDLAGR